MLLSDVDLWNAITQGELSVSPRGLDCIQPASIDLRLGDGFRKFSSTVSREWPCGKTLDPFGPDRELPVMVGTQAEFVTIHPQEFLLAHTLETVKLGPMLVARIEGRSTLGRLGLIVHATAGFVDPGFEGQLTLEMYNASPNRILLRAGMPIAQLAVQRLSSPAERPYGDPERRSKYHGQTGATPARPLNEKGGNDP